MVFVSPTVLVGLGSAVSHECPASHQDRGRFGFVQLKFVSAAEPDTSSKLLDADKVYLSV